MLRKSSRLTIIVALAFAIASHDANSAEQKVEEKAAQKAEPRAPVAEKEKKVEQNPAKPAAEGKDAITTLLNALFNNGNNNNNRARPQAAPNRQNEAMIKQMLPQYMQQYRPALTAELTFIRQVCDLPKEHRPKIKAVGEKSLETSVREMVEMQFGGNGRVVRRNSSEFDPTKRIREALQQGLKESLTPEQFAHYNKEASERANRFKRAAIFFVVSQIDSTLSLSGEQRDQIYESISSSWQEKWENWLQLQNYGGQYFPQIPDPLIVTHLNPNQKQVWSGLQKIEVGVMSINRGEAAENDDWWGDEAAAPQNQPVLNLVPAIVN